VFTGTSIALQLSPISVERSTCRVVIDRCRPTATTVLVFGTSWISFISAVVSWKLFEVQLIPPSVDCAITPTSPDMIINDPCFSSE
jgi:hypothetical protein